MRLGSGRVAVDPDRARVEEPLEPLGAGGLEQVEGAVDVDGVGLRRIIDDLVHIRHRREVEDRVAARDRLANRFGVGEVGEPRLDSSSACLRRRREVEDDGLCPASASLSTTCEPMKPDPPVTSALHWPTAWSAGDAGR